MTSVDPAQVTIRRARRADLEDIARIVADPPSDVTVGISGGHVERARRLGVELVRMGVSLQLADTSVAEADGRVAGVIDAGAKGDVRITPTMAVRVVAAAVRIGGPAWAVRSLWRQRVQGRVNFEIPLNSYYIAELDVDAPLRNRGIGGMLLRHAEVLARGHGCTRLSLTTTITNPARHLYDRHGYAVAGEKRDVEYERITGVPGRVLMVKDLQPV